VQKTFRIVTVLAVLAALAVMLPAGADAPAGTQRVGVYTGPANVAGQKAFEAWLGGDVSVAMDYLDQSSWSAFDDTDWLLGPWSGWVKEDPTRLFVLSVPLLTRDSAGQLRSGANGAFDAHFRQLAQKLVARGMSSTVIRLGWEMNGGWFPWSGVGDPAAYTAMFRHVVGVMRAVPGARFGFEWTPNGGRSQVSSEALYPGDDVVDVIGLDQYDIKWEDSNAAPDARWQFLLTEPYGLNWHRTFARAHGKPMAYSEWALWAKGSQEGGGGDDPAYISHMADWFASNDVAYHIYFDVPEGGVGGTITSFAQGAATYRARFAHAPAAGIPSFPPQAATPPKISPSGQLPPEATTDLQQYANRPGYWMVDRAGHVYGFGRASGLSGSAGSAGAAFVDVQSTRSGNGYWTVDEAGHVYTKGDAPYLGGASGLQRSERVVSMGRTASGHGYWLFTSLGRALPFGDAPRLGDLSGHRLNAAVIDSAVTPSGHGYYMVAADGGVFSFGDAGFYGSTGSMRLNAPVRSLVVDGDGVGYRLVASDGGVFAYRAGFYGSLGGMRLNQPVTGMVGTAHGYLMVAADGGAFAFGDASFAGSLASYAPPSGMVAISVQG
jgi:hypothetical protein